MDVLLHRLIKDNVDREVRDTVVEIIVLGRNDNKVNDCVITVGECCIALGPMYATDHGA